MYLWGGGGGGGGLIEILDTSKYHCACVCCAQACIEVHDYV